ncbi:MAG: hypothetical protein ACREFP_11810 [Acetobacteraceae bacterium]
MIIDDPEAVCRHDAWCRRRSGHDCAGSDEQGGPKRSKFEPPILPFQPLHAFSKSLHLLVYHGHSFVLR